MADQYTPAPAPSKTEFNTLNTQVQGLAEQLENKVGKYRQNISGHSSITASDISAFLSGYTGYGAVSVDFYRTDNQNIVASMYYCKTNVNYGAGILVSYYDDGLKQVLCSGGTVTIKTVTVAT